MLDTPDIAGVAALLGDATRGKMLAALMAGRALTATELALAGGVTASTASSHLARLSGAGLISLVSQGRHRYYRLATPEVAAAIEGLMGIAPRAGRGGVRVGPLDERLRRARVCYDHLAGEAAVRLLERLREAGVVAGDGPALRLAAKGEAWCGRAGIELAALRRKRRPVCRACLDWTERRTHLAGSLGAAILERLFALRYARREVGSRAVVLSAQADRFVERLDFTARC